MNNNGSLGNYRGAGIDRTICQALDRREALIGLGSLALVSCGTPLARRNGAPSLSVSIDDFDITDGPLLTAAQRHTAILAALDAHRIKACGFPVGRYIDRPDGQRPLLQWAERGHAIGCHSYAHAYYSGKDPAAFAADLDRALPLVARYPTSVPLFRFPFLAEGRTAQGRDAARATLASRGLRNGHVTIDTSDWYIASRLSKRLKADPAADVAPYRAFYLAHMLDRATYYDTLAREVFGRSIPHSLLFHHNLAAALFLGDTLAMFRKRGWRLIDATAAFSDPVYRREPQIVPAGQSLPWQVAKESGRFEQRLRYPAEDGDYEKAAMDRLEL